MNSKSAIWIGMFIGTTAGSYLPTLWGAGYFSFSSVILSTIGGLIGIYAGFKIGNI